MTIYEYTTSLTVVGGAISSSTLPIRDGLLRQMIVRAGTDTTTFFVDLVNDRNVTVINWGQHVGELNDWDITLPVQGPYTLNITNASVVDTFTINMGVQE